MNSPLTPSQTAGPFLAIGLPWPDGPFVVPDGSPDAITITGTVVDGAGEPLPDALVETWQADPRGRFAHPDDPRVGSAGAGPTAAGPAASFRGFGRCATDESGRYRIVTLRPGPLPCPDGRTEAPHLDVSVFARGLLDRVVTRIYFPDEEAANAADPVLATIASPRRATLIATAVPPVNGPAGDRVNLSGNATEKSARSLAGEPAREFRFDIRLQGEQETVFFDV